MGNIKKTFSPQVEMAKHLYSTLPNVTKDLVKNITEVETKANDLFIKCDTIENIMEDIPFLAHIKESAMLLKTKLHNITLEAQTLANEAERQNNIYHETYY